MVPEILSIGEVAERSGLAVSAIRFYEQRGLVEAERADSGHRRFHRDVLRRLAFIQVAQRVGLSLDEIGEVLASVPSHTGPSGDEWRAVSEAWRPRLDERIRILEGLRDALDSCIGCGCLSLDKCRLANPADCAAELGTGPRYLLGDRPVRRGGGRRSSPAR